MFISAFKRTCNTIHHNSTSALGKHLSDCEHAQYLASLQNQFSLLNDIPLPTDNVPTPIENLVFNNFWILHLTRSTSYNILAFRKTFDKSFRKAFEILTKKILEKKLEKNSKKKFWGKF